MARGGVLEDGDELGLPWDEWADGRVWRLRKGKHFTRSSRAVQAAARNAALRMDRAVRTVVDRRGGGISLWVQFADYEIDVDDPCPCGSTDLRRLNRDCAVCGSCGSSLLLVKPKGEKRPSEKRRETPAAPRTVEEAPVEAEPEAEAEAAPDRPPPPDPTKLSAYSGVRLFPYDSSDRRERYCGYGRDAEGKLVLLLADFPLIDGERVADPDGRDEYVHRASAWNVGPFLELIDISALLERTDPVEGLIRAESAEEPATQVVRLPERDDSAEEERPTARVRPAQQRKLERREAALALQEEVRRQREVERQAGLAAKQARTERKVARPPRPPGVRLAAYQDVSLFLLDRTPERERYFGYGRDRLGGEVLLLVRFPLSNGARVPDREYPGEYRHTVRSLPVAPFGRVVGLDQLTARTPEITSGERLANIDLGADTVEARGA